MQWPEPRPQWVDPFPAFVVLVLVVATLARWWRSRKK